MFQSHVSTSHRFPLHPFLRVLALCLPMSRWRSWSSINLSRVKTTLPYIWKHTYPPVNKHSNGKSPSWIGNTSTNGGFSIAMLDYRSVPSWKPLLLGVCFMLCPFSGGDDKICFFSIIQGSEVTISTCKMHLAASRFSDASFLMESFRLCFFSRSVHLLFFWRILALIKDD